MSHFTLRRPTAALLAALLVLPSAAFAQDESTPAEVDEAAVATPAPTPAPVSVESLSLERLGDGEDVTVTGATARSVWAAGRTVDVQVTAPDVFAAGETVRTRGAVLDNFVGAGREVTVEGPIGGDAFLFGESLVIRADVAGDVYAAGETLRIPADVTVGGNVYFGGATLDLDGSVGGSLLGGGATFALDGRVEGDVEVETAKLVVGSNARIGGALDYTAPQEASIAAGAAIGSVEWTQKAVDVEQDSGDSAFRGVGFRLFMLLGSLLLGGALLGLFPRVLSEPAKILEEESPVALGIGFAVLLGVPVLALFLAVFILPIPLSFFAMAVWLPALFLARFIAAFALGGLVLTRFGKTATPLGALMTGLVILGLASAIPLLGGLVMLAATVLGLGALFLAARRAGQAQAA